MLLIYILFKTKILFLAQASASRNTIELVAGARQKTV